MRTLLLADDNLMVQRVIALTFAGEAIQVVAVADGQQAMEKMSAQQPDIVLAGTTLPNGNGYDLARFMRSRTELQMVPVLLLAGAFEMVDDERVRSSGANGILEKPVEPTTLISRVKELLGLKSDDKPAPMGRLVTTGAAPVDRTRPPATSSGRALSTASSAGKPVFEVDGERFKAAEASPEMTDEMLDRIASKVADRLTASAFGDALKEAMAATMRETVRNVVNEIAERMVRDTVQAVAVEATERVVRDTVQTVVTDASERAVRETVPAVVAGTSERLLRETMPAVIAETSERMVGGAVFGVVVEASERLIRDAVPMAVTETSERIIRDAVPAAVAAASERVVRESMRSIILETSERLVREEIERIKSRTAT